MPTDPEKKEILDYYKEVYNVKGKPSMDGWTGAEVEAACKIAAMLDEKLDNIGHLIKPISKVMDKEIKDLRDWAKHRCIMGSEELPTNGKAAKRKVVY
jgi:hypothetical protein